jgi:hypothetical protein
VPTAGSTTQGRSKTFTVREILERPTEVMAEIANLAASLGEDEVLVCEAPSCPQPIGGPLSSLGLELVVDDVTDGVRSTAFRRARSGERG